MRSAETQVVPLNGNPIHVNGYLVYGDGRPAEDGSGFEAWFWLSQPHEAGDGWETLECRRCQSDKVFETAGEAVVNALMYGRHVASEMHTGRFISQYR